MILLKNTTARESNKIGKIKNGKNGKNGKIWDLDYVSLIARILVNFLTQIIV